MIDKKQIALISILVVVAGIIFFAYQESWVLLIFSSKKTTEQIQIDSKPTEVTLFFWKHDKWNSEKNSYIQSSDPANNIQTIAHLYFRLLDDEEIIHNDTTVNSVVIHKNNQIAFVSCNQSPFHAQDSTRKKIMIIQGFLKTCKENNMCIPYIQFLINHQPLQDDHLDFTIPWPLSGYL
jgi:hypothetical protein